MTLIKNLSAFGCDQVSTYIVMRPSAAEVRYV